MSLKNEYNKTNAAIQNNFRAPIATIASLDCMDEIGYSTDGSMTTNPPSRQVSVTAPSGIKYRNLGKSGLRISNLALGTWVTFGTQMSEELAEDVVTAAYENGINMFDTADVYGSGRAETLLGKILKKKGWRRSSYVVATKLFWTIKIDSERSLSRKNIIEGLQASLERLQLSYVDIVFANKADPMVPMEEVVRAFTYCINQGMTMYWGTSKWSSMEIMEAYSVARACNLIPPLVEQAEYHMFQRDKVELYMPELFYKIGVGTITWCPQMFGIAGGKCDEGIQLLSRGSVRSFAALTDKMNNGEPRPSPKHQSKVQELAFIADKIGCTPAQLTLAWCLKNENVQSVLIGVTTVDQLYSHLQALQLLPKLTSTVISEIEKILDNKPIRPPPPR